MSEQSKRRRAAARPTKPGILRVLSRPLSQVGERADDLLGPILARPLADYYLLLISTAVLLGLGIIMVGSASSVSAGFGEENDPYYYLKRQIVFTVVGSLIAWLVSRLQAVWLARISIVALAVSIILLIAIMTPLGVEHNGNRAWLNIFGVFEAQPSEFAKASLILYAAMVFANRRKTLNTLKGLLIPVLPLFAVVEGLIIFVQGDMGTAMIIGGIFFAMLWFVGAPMRVIGGLGVLGALAAFLGIITSSHRRAKVMSFWTGDSTDSNQPLNALYGLATGGWFGVGLGASRQKWGGLYDGAMNDYVLAVLGEEMGLVGVLAVLALFGILTFAGLRVASRSTSVFMRHAAAGMTAWIIIQALVNIMVAFNLLPVLGVPLPFVSYGGSALLSNLFAIGVLIAAARQEPGAAEVIAAKKTKGNTPKLTAIVDTGSRKRSRG